MTACFLELLVPERLAPAVAFAILAALAAACVACVPATARAPASAPEPPAAALPEGLTSRLPEIARAHAPRVWWHPDEEFGPMDPVRFAQESSLWLRRDGGVARAPGRRVASAGAWEISEIASRGSRGLGHYLRHEARGARGAIDWDALSGTVPLLWRLSETAAPPPGEGTGARRVLIEYWYYSPYNRSPVPWLGDHPGDWESLAALVEVSPAAGGGPRHALKALYLSAHESGRWHCPERLSFAADGDVPGALHPEVFSALGTHATYPAPGDYHHPFLTDRAQKGFAWDAWRLVRHLGGEPYYGFQGAWGEPGPLPFMGGPLGPGPGSKPLPRPLPPERARRAPWPSPGELARACDPPPRPP